MMWARRHPKQERKKLRVIPLTLPKKDTDSNQKNRANPKAPLHNPSRGNRKQNWQDKNKGKPRQRQKFKKPKKLPFRKTEVRPLEIGSLLENEEIKTEEGLLSIAEMFAGSEGSVISLDELLPLNLLDLKEKVGSLPVEIELPSAPLRGDYRFTFGSMLGRKKPVRVSGIIQVMEDGHGFLLQEIENYRLKSQSPFVPAPLIKKYGLKTGQCMEGFLRSRMDEATRLY